MGLLVNISFFDKNVCSKIDCFCTTCCVVEFNRFLVNFINLLIIKELCHFGVVWGKELRQGYVFLHHKDAYPCVLRIRMLVM